MFIILIHDCIVFWLNRVFVLYSSDKPSKASQQKKKLIIHFCILFEALKTALGY